MERMNGYGAAFVSVKQKSSRINCALGMSVQSAHVFWKRKVDLANSKGFLGTLFSYNKGTVIPLTSGHQRTVLKFQATCFL